VAPSSDISSTVQKETLDDDDDGSQDQLSEEEKTSNVGHDELKAANISLDVNSDRLEAATEIQDTVGQEEIPSSSKTDTKQRKERVVLFEDSPATPEKIKELTFEGLGFNYGNSNIKQRRHEESGQATLRNH
jgi:hypothetical protein